MAKIVRSGSIFGVSSHTEVLDRLPVGTYMMMFDEKNKQFYLEQIPSLELGTTRLYGDVLGRCERILRTFMARPGNTGVILSGSKGSGKSLLARAVSIGGSKLDIPTIVVNQAHFGDSFNSFLEALEQPIMVMFDEYEKIYETKPNQPNPQTNMLTLFDGVVGGPKRLYLVTVNDIKKVDSYMLNRPGRFYYHYSYANLSTEFVKEYAEDNLSDKGQLEGLMTFAGGFAEFNFDMLKGLVEEMNRYDESARDVSRVLNVDPAYESAVRYELTSFEFTEMADTNIVKVRNYELYGSSFLNPLKESVQIQVRGAREDGSSDTDYHTLMYTDIVGAAEGQFFYEGMDYKATLTRSTKSTFKMIERS